MKKSTWSWMGLLGICALALPVAAQDLDLTEAIEGPAKANVGADVDVNVPKANAPEVKAPKAVTPPPVAPPVVQTDDALPVPATQADAAVDVDVRADRAPRLDSQLEGEMKAQANVDPAVPNPGVDVDATTDIDARVRADMDRNRNDDRDHDHAHNNNDRAAKWRYKQHNGEWWYWTTAGNWMYHRGGTWVTYNRANYSYPSHYHPQRAHYGGQAYYDNDYYNGPNRTYYRGGNNSYRRGYNNGYGPNYYGGNRGAQQGANIGAGIGGAIGGQGGANLGAGIGAAIGGN